MNITLAYNNGTEVTQTFAALSVKGFDEPDEFKLVGVQHRYLSGTVLEQIQGFQRVLTLDLGVATKAERDFLWAFLHSPTRQIRDTLTSLFLDVALEDPTRYSDEWLEGTKYGARFILRLVNKNVETIVFDPGSGYGYDYGNEYGTGL